MSSASLVASCSTKDLSDDVSASQVDEGSMRRASPVVEGGVCCESTVVDGGEGGSCRLIMHAGLQRRGHRELTAAGPRVRKLHSLPFPRS
jgi:hypothetical protein